VGPRTGRRGERIQWCGRYAWDERVSRDVDGEYATVIHC